DEPIAMHDLINRLLAADGLPAVEPRVPPALALVAGRTLEGLYRLLRIPREPRLTVFVARQLSTAHWFRLEAARRDFGYTPTVSMAEGLERLARHREKRS
ncbi:MAG: 3-beta hydroxysteroid dehydrogenase, partial [Planctomycetota bacterium]